MKAKSIPICYLFLSLAVCSCDKVPEDSESGMLVESMELNLETTGFELERYKTFQLSVSFYPETAADAEYEWISSNPEIATVSKTGLVKAVSEGETIVGASLVNGRKRAVAVVKVTPYIAENPIKTIILNETEHAFSDITDQPFQLETELVATDPEQPISMEDLSWSTSDLTVVQVSKDGQVTVVGGGSAVIRCEALDGGNAFAECQVTVPGIGIKDRYYDCTGPQFDDGYYKKIYEQIEIEVPIIKKDGTKTGETEIQVWLDRNLGAERRATSYNDYKSFGSMFQWSRKADGHEKVRWSMQDGKIVAEQLSGISEEKAEDRENVGHSNFIKTTNTETWAPDIKSGLWGGKMFDINAGAPTDAQFRDMSYSAPLESPSQANNPCPKGYRVPTVLEVHQLMLAVSGLNRIVINNPGNTISNATTVFATTPPYIAFSGNRPCTKPEIVQNYSVWIMWWTNSVAKSGNQAWQMRVQNNGKDFRVQPYWLSMGYAVRCIKD